MTDASFALPRGRASFGFRPPALPSGLADREIRLRLGTGAQLMGLATTALIAGWLGVTTMSNIGSTNPRDAELARLQAQIAALKADRSALKGAVMTSAQRIEARQAFLAGLLTGKASDHELVGLLPRTVARVGAPADPVTAGVLAPFAELEEKQLAFVDRASATAEARLRDAESLLGRLKLEPSRFVAQTSLPAVGRLGMGGPFVPVGSDTDDRFADLYVNWQRVRQLHDAMRALPSHRPVKNFTYTSNFGFRYDPFHGGGARHSGLDMAGAHNEPIHATAAGRVVRAGWYAGYGNCIDIDHGRGIVTRYGHLANIDVAVGDTVTAGQHIAGMGSTGRSTGTHLHFEVRVDDRPVNPRPFLDATDYVLAMHRGTPEAQLAALD